MKTSKHVGVLVTSLTLGMLVQAQQINLIKTPGPASKSFSGIKGAGPGSITTLKLPATVVSKPGNSEDFIWDEENSEWYHYSNTVYSYTSSGLLSEEISTEATSGMNLSRYTYTYDESGTVTNETTYLWDGFNWYISEGYNYIYVYDNTGRLTEEINQFWDGVNWVNEQKLVYIYNNNDEPDQVMGYTWFQDTWQWIRDYTGVAWHSWPKREVSAYTLKQKYEGGMWVNTERYTATFSGSGSVAIYEAWTGLEWYNYERETQLKSETEEIFRIEYFENGDWTNYEQTITSMDDYGNLAGFQYELWENDAWVIAFKYQFDHTYSSNADITETIVRFWEPGLPSLTNIARYLYSNFLYFETGVPSNASDYPAELFPNPVHSVLNIRLTSPHTDHYEMDIINLNGQVIYSERITQSASALNLSWLDPGLYVIRLKNQQGVVNSSMILKN